MLETVGRNTAPAVALAAMELGQRYGQDTVMLVLAADHLIGKPDAFAQAVAQAEQLALEGKLVTFGIQPTSPETGYGYIDADGNTVRKFVEKPDLATAQRYLTAGNYLWNSGIFCFTVGTVLAELAKHASEILEPVQIAFDQAARKQGEQGTELEISLEHAQAIPDISVDYALMERSDQVAVVPCEIGWSDVGSWNSIGELTPTDDQGNRIEGQGQNLLHDTRNCYIKNDSGRIVATVGLDNLTIIDTPDAVLIADSAKTQDVKAIVTRLKSSNHDAYKIHRTAHRPWGTYTVLEEGDGFKMKRIEVKPGCSLSLQLHHHRSEHWIVVSGMAEVVNGDNTILVRPNESTYIPAGQQHRLINPGKTTCVLIEVQVGSYLEEDDIVRLQDVYGRA